MAKNTLSIIIIVDFLDTQVEALILVLQIFRRAIRGTIADILWIPPGIRTHKIQLESNCVPIIEQQNYLNLPMKGVVNKEIIKWLDVGAVYPIMASKWVCPI